MKKRYQPPRQRITITLDIVDEPGNDTIAAAALNDILRRFDHDAIITLYARLEIEPAPTT